MSRLDELKRQRALLAQHLDWLDREIASESGPPLPVQSLVDAEVTESRRDDQPALEIPDHLLSESNERIVNARRGCIVAFSSLLLAFALAVAALYFLKYRR